MIQKLLVHAGITALAIGAVTTGALVTGTGSAAQAADYSIADLLAPCVQADNDAREGAAAEVECEQYILGFADAYGLLAEGGAAAVCLPAQNRADEVRWAFTKWATQNYGERHRPAAEGLRITLETAFACP